MANNINTPTKTLINNDFSQYQHLYGHMINNNDNDSTNSNNNNIYSNITNNYTTANSNHNNTVSSILQSTPTSSVQNNNNNDINYSLNPLNMNSTNQAYPIESLNQNTNCIASNSQISNNFNSPSITHHTNITQDKEQHQSQNSNNNESFSDINNYDNHYLFSDFLVGLPP